MKKTAFRRSRFLNRAQGNAFKKINPVAGNVFFALFAAVIMLGAVGYGFNSVMRGPIKGMTEVTKRTVAESTIITSSRIAIVGATTKGTVPGGDCDNDGKIEPLPYYDAGTSAHPTGGGWLPRGSGPPAWTLVSDSLDPWKNEYGYCSWDSGAVIADVACGGATGRLAGSPNDNRPAIAIISAGKDKIFQTSCTAYSALSPNASLVTKAANSDDIVLTYTYAEANNLGNGLWKPSPSAPTTTAKSDKALDVVGGGTFSDKVVLSAGGLVLPGDPGDDSITGACDATNDKQMRRNTSTIPPTLEICDFTGGLGWNPISGGSATTGSTTGTLVSRWKLDESSGTIALDSIGYRNGVLVNSPTWNPTGGKIGGAISVLNASNQYVQVRRSTALEPTAMTISAWVKRSGAQTSYATIFSKSYGAGAVNKSFGVTFDNNSDDTIRFYTAYDLLGAGHALVSTSAIIPDGEWVHVVAVYDPAGTAPQKRLYINGVLDQSVTVTTAIAYDTSSNGDFYIGASRNNYQVFNGAIDDVRVYNYGLSDAEVTTLYSTSQSQLNVPKTVEIGKLLSWGDDTNGKLGNGPDYTNTNVPRSVVDGDNFTQVDAGPSMSCGTTVSGRAYCWGDDTNGRLGNGATYGNTDYARYPVSGLSNVIKVSAGLNHGCALKKSGEVWCWGNSQSFGALGDGSTSTTSQIPVKVYGNTDYVDVSAGGSSSCAIRQNGEAWCWGSGTDGQLGNGASSNSAIPVKVSTISNFVRVEVSKDTNYAKACGVTESGSAYCWGEESTSNEFGNGAASGIQNTPQEVTNTSKDFVQMSINDNTSCAVRKNGQIWCAGLQTNGGLGNGLTAGTSNVPVVITDRGEYIKVSTSTTHSCGLRASGEVWCWGDDTNGQLGNGAGITGVQSTPVKVMAEGFNDISVAPSATLGLQAVKVDKTPILDFARGRIAAGTALTCYIDGEGALWCWGNDSFGELGNGPSVTANQESPYPVTATGKWKKVDTSTNHVCGIKGDGTLWCWGTDGSGEVGNGGTTGDQDTPVQIGTDVWADIAVAPGASCGIKIDGTLWCWGADSVGQLGNGAGISNSNAPAQITEAGPWVKVSMAGTSGTACAIKADGSLWCWGAGTLGQTGSGISTNQQTPTMISEPGPWKDVSAGDVSCGVKSNGSLWCWGDTVSGTGTGNALLVPQLISAQEFWSSVSTNTSSICGIKYDGSAMCWGTNTNGQLGIGSTTAQTEPSLMDGAGKWVAMAAGHQYTCGIKSDESVWCWGADTNGQLGNGSVLTADQTSPYRSSYGKGPKWPIGDSANVTSFGPPSNVVGINIGTSRAISEDGTAGTKGFMFGTGGKQSFLQNAGGNQLTLETYAPSYGPQISFKDTPSVTGYDDLYGLVARWKFDETTGTTAYDSVGGNNGTLYSTTSWNAGGKLNRAVYFDGTGNTSYIEVPRTKTLENSGFTISFWMKRNGAQNTYADMISKAYVNNTSPAYKTYGFYFNNTSDTQITFSVGYSGGQYTINSGAAAISDNTWYHVVGTYDYAISGNKMNFYIDGVSVGSAAGGNAPILDQTSTGNLFFGAGQAGNSVTRGIPERYTGYLDDVRIYNRALSASEITRLYNSYSPGLNMVRTLGLDYVSGNLELFRNASGATGWASNYLPDMEWDVNGNLGIGTAGAVQAKVDVAGAVKVGNDGGACTAGRVGTIDYNSGSWQYCSASGWRTFGSFNTSGWRTTDAYFGSGGTNCWIKSNGTGWCWGYGTDGQLGNNTFAPSSSFPIQVLNNSGGAGWSDWKMISGGGGVNCGVRYNGTGWCWGTGFLGANGGSPSSLPIQVKDNAGSSNYTDWVSIYGTCGVRRNGTAWCWGYGGVGELGNNAFLDYDLPQQVVNSAGGAGWTDWVVVKDGAQGSTSCGIRSNGEAWCWGYGADAGLGNNSTSNTAVPVRVVMDTGAGAWTDWVDVVPLQYMTCGIRRNGTAWCWGKGYRGDGTNNGTATAIPVQVQTDTGPGGWSDWVSLTGSQEFLCGVRANGTAWCWGKNYWAPLDGVGDVSRPRQVLSDTGGAGWSDWIWVNAGQYSTCGVRSNGTLWCWGYAANGQLGDGQSSTNRTNPVQVPAQ